MAPRGSEEQCHWRCLGVEHPRTLETSCDRLVHNAGRGAHLGVVLHEVGVVAVGLGHQRHESLLHRRARPHQQLRHVVQVGAVALRAVSGMGGSARGSTFAP